MTCNGRRPQNIKSGISQQPLIRSYSNLYLDFIWPNHVLQILHMKKTSHGKWPQNIKNEISHQPHIGLYSNFKLKIRWVNHILQILKMKKIDDWRWPTNIKSEISKQSHIGSYLPASWSWSYLKYLTELFLPFTEYIGLSQDWLILIVTN